jgi:hypothetical protein
MLGHDTWTCSPPEVDRRGDSLKDRVNGQLLLQKWIKGEISQKLDRIKGQLPLQKWIEGEIPQKFDRVKGQLPLQKWIEGEIPQKLERIQGHRFFYCRSEKCHDCICFYFTLL